MRDEEAFDSDEQFKAFIDLVMQHWNDVGKRLNEEEVFLPALFNQNDQGIYTGNDWATGFLRGMDYHRDDLSDLLDDQQQLGSMVSIFALAYEHAPDPDLRPYSEPVNAERREDLLAGLAAGVTRIYRYLAPQRKMAAQLAKEAGTIRRDHLKVGRNAPCPCGSGKKYKKCCGNVTVH